VDHPTVDVIRAQLVSLVPFANHAGVELRELADGHAIAVLPEAPFTLNHVGTQHAAALYTVAEVASGAAMVGLLDPFMVQAVAVVREANARYLMPATGVMSATATSTVEASLVRREYEAEGRAAFAIAATLADAAGDTVAIMTFEWVAWDRSASAGNTA
jgi:acyl-coenzyme A thioesterase PaaI-like protein